MLFDWFTVLAQVVNFLILMWLLKRFLYKPVLDAIDAREQRIALLLEETEASQRQAELQQQELTKKNQQFAEQQAVDIEKAKADAEQLKQTMVDEASESVSVQRSQWLAGLQKEQQHLDQEISQRTQHEVLHVARKVLRDLSGASLEDQMIATFIGSLQQLATDQRQQFIEGLEGDLIIRTAATLSETQKQSLTDTIQRIFSDQVSIRFAVDEQLIGGIELLGSGHKLSWNIEDYLSGLEESIAELVEHKVSGQLNKGNSDVG